MGRAGLVPHALVPGEEPGLEPLEGGWVGDVAPLVVDGALNGAVFRAYVEQQLTNVLKPGDIVAMGNLSSRKVAGVREAIAAAGATVMYLPPYSQT